MKKINPKRLPTRLNFMPLVVYPTALSYWNAPQWLWGIGLFILALSYVALFIAIHNECTNYEEI